MGKVSSFSKLPSSLGFQKFKSEEAIRVPEEHSTDLSKKKNANKSIVQKEKIHIYSPNKGSQEEVSQSNQQKNVIQNQQQNFRGKISPRFSNVTPYRTNYEYKPK